MTKCHLLKFFTKMLSFKVNGHISTGDHSDLNSRYLTLDKKKPSLNIMLFCLKAADF